MPRYAINMAIVVLAVAAAGAAQAKPRHGDHRYVHRSGAVIVCDLRGCSDRVAPAKAKKEPRRIIDANGNGVIVGRRPKGCPHAYCGCEASLYVFGAIRPRLNRAYNWMVDFPRAAPAPGMAAVRPHHVMVLMRHIGGSQWLVHDGNSGGGLTREHVMSIKGYVVVDPQGSRTARAEN
ncbi:MAG TPA: hypothetical protein VFT69_19360 [Pseudolabrys sp.]|jgi:hypothetical protein|nr:hypothetical protein [Pseudolabrys sp.]